MHIIYMHTNINPIQNSKEEFILNKTTITEVATGTALICGAIDSAIDGRRIRRLEKEAVKQRKRFIASTTIGSTGVVGVGIAGIVARRRAKNAKAEHEHLNEQLTQLRKDFAALDNKYDINARVTNMEKYLGWEARLNNIERSLGMMNQNGSNGK